MKLQVGHNAKRGAYFFLGVMLFITMLLVVDYVLELHIYRKLRAEPCLLKSPNECASLNVSADQ